MAELVNPLKQKLAAGKPIIGTAVTSPSPQLMRMFVECGFDWLMIDLEHGPIGAESTHAMVNATLASDCVPVARLPAGDTWMAKMALDAGVLGLFFPLIMDGLEADQAIRSATYPPRGDRGFGPFHARYRWQQTLTEYALNADDAILKIIMIEHFDAVDRIDEILDVDGIDMIFIAPYDLSQSLGLPGQFDDPRFVETAMRAERAVQKAGIPLGTFVPTVEKGRQHLDRGYKLLMFAYDGMLIENAITPLVRDLQT
ncbi:MAG: 2,4-dihydroxyhept-2-ene-1,7-dioic acid aldolase [Rhodospirillales bacterium]|nr:2,4-dihydroxyhept-2-ene-1,7-dioic acid aldolase [Rhodospirillales bacterium]